MAQTIRVRRGTKAELQSYGTLALAELGFCTDTKEVYIGSGTENILIGPVLSGTLAARPAAATSGKLYFVTSGSQAGSMFFDDGTAWRNVNAQSLGDLAGNLDNIQDGTAYKKVVAGDITSGHVNKVSDGVNAKTAGEIKTHIDNAGIHRSINDTGVGATDLWSAQKTKGEITNAINTITIIDGGTF